jgi:hypothetical protein
LTTKISIVKQFITLSTMRTITLVVVLAGAASALGLMLHAGRNNDSVLLVVLFVIWVVSPFIALLVANVVSKRWPFLTRVTLYSLTLMLTLGSLMSYSGALSPLGTKPAFVFLVVPLVSWLLMAIVIPVAASVSRRRSRRSGSV